MSSCSPFAYLIPYANRHALESTNGPDVYADALTRFTESIPGSLSEEEREYLIRHWQIVWTKHIGGNSKGTLSY